MSVTLDDPDHEITTEELLKEILRQLVLLNHRYEEATNTGIHDEDVK